MELSQILVACLDSDNQVRQAAEALLKDASKSPDIIPPLLKEVSESKNPQVRQLAAILLRKSITALWSKSSSEIHGTIKTVLLHRVREEAEPAVRRALVDVVAVIAKHALPSGGWAELLPFLHECHGSGAKEQREAAVTLLTALADGIPDVLRPHASTLQDMFVKGLEDPEVSVRVASLAGISSLLRLSEPDGSSAPALQRMVPLILSVLHTCLQQGVDDGLMTGVELLLDLIEVPMPVLAPCLPQVVEFSMNSALNKELDVDTRAYCLQVVLWLAAYKPKQLLQQKVVPHIINALCSMATEATLNDPDDDEDEPDEEPPSKIAVQALDSISQSVPSKHVLPTVLQFAQAAIQSPNALERLAACSVVAVCAEGCCEGMKSKLSALLSVLLRGAKDAEAEVRACALFGVDQLATHVPDVAEHHEALLPVVFNLLLNDASKKVTKRAIYAVDALLELLDEDVVEPYVAPLVQRLVIVLREAPTDMHGTALSCLATAASCCGAAFAPYAEQVLPLLRQYLSLTSDSMLTARARATECVGLVAETLGADTAEKLLPEFLEAAVEGFELDYSELREYGHGLFATAARVLKQRFAPYLWVVVPLAFESLAQDDGVMRHSKFDDSDDSDEDEGGSDGVGREEEFQVRTGVSDEKASALQALGLYAEHTTSAFMAYMKQTLDVVTANTRYFHADVRRQAVEAMPRLVHATHAASPSANPSTLSDETKHILETTLPHIFAAIKDDLDRSVVTSCMVALGDIMACLPPGSLAAAMPAIVQAFEGVLQGNATCQGDMQKSEDEEDEDDMDAVVEADEELVACAADALPKLARSLGAEAFMQVFREHVGQPFFVRLKPTQSAAMRSAMVGTMAEIIQAVGEHVQPYVEVILPVLHRELKSEESENRHHAVFCLGVLIEACPQALGSDTLAAIHPLLSDTEGGVADNACGAVARIACANADSLPLEQLLPVLLDALPLRSDWEEAGAVYGALSQLMTGSQGPKLVCLRPRVCIACGQVAVQKGVAEEVRRTAAQLVKSLHALDPQGIEGCVAAMPAEQQAALQQLSA